MRYTRMVRDKRRWLGLILPTIAVVTILYFIYAQASGTLDRDHLYGLFIIAMALSFAPRDLQLLTSGDYRERWHALTGRLAFLNVGLHLFSLVFGVGVGLSMLLGLVDELSGLVYGLSLILLVPPPLSVSVFRWTALCTGKLSSSSRALQPITIL